MNEKEAIKQMINEWIKTVVATVVVALACIAFAYLMLK
jgi:hypothetical protein